MENKLQKLSTNQDFIKYGQHLFEEHHLYYGHGTTTALDESAYLVLTITGDIYDVNDLTYDKKVSAENVSQIHAVFNRRVNEKIPAAYLLGEAWFFNLPFYVNEHVLVPRSPFAELVNEGFMPWLNQEKVNNILDLCTGSGCIGIACAVAFPSAHVDLADISAEALAVANSNIERHHLQERVNTVESNLLHDLPVKQYDLIVSNPPYVGHQELEGLPDEFFKEPRLGLDGGENGLDLLHDILAYAADYLTDDGLLYMEVGNSDELLQQCYPKVPFLWQEFEYGGHGVFMLTKSQLIEFKPQFLVNLAT